jgi:hypothetical protein
MFSAVIFLFLLSLGYYLTYCIGKLGPYHSHQPGNASVTFPSRPRKQSSLALSKSSIPPILQRPLPAGSSYWKEWPWDVIPPCRHWMLTWLENLKEAWVTGPANSILTLTGPIFASFHFLFLSHSSAVTVDSSKDRTDRYTSLWQGTETTPKQQWASWHRSPPLPQNEGNSARRWGCTPELGLLR